MRSLTFTKKTLSLPVIDGMTGKRIGVRCTPMLRKDDLSRGCLAVFCGSSGELGVRLVAFSDVLYVNEAMAIAVQIDPDAPFYMNVPYDEYAELIGKRACSPDGTSRGTVVSAVFDVRSSMPDVITLDEEGIRTELSRSEILALEDNRLILRRDLADSDYALYGSAGRSGTMRREDVPDMLSSIRQSLDVISQLYGDEEKPKNARRRMPAEPVPQLTLNENRSRRAPEKPQQNSFSDYSYTLTGSYADDSSDTYFTDSASFPEMQKAIPSEEKAQDGVLNKRLENIESLLGQMAQKDEKPAEQPEAKAAAPEKKAAQSARPAAPAKNPVQPGQKPTFWQRNGVKLTALFLYSLACYLMSILHVM